MNRTLPGMGVLSTSRPSENASPVPRARYAALAVALMFLLAGTWYQGLLWSPLQRMAALIVLPIGSLAIARYGIPVSWRRPAVVSLLVWLGGFVISLPFAASPVEAIPGFAYMVALGFAFVMGVWLGRSPGSTLVASDIITIVALFANWIGFLAMGGFIQLVDAYSESAFRLASTFQYPNVLAIVATVGVLSAVVTKDSKGMLGWRHFAIASGLLALLLTGSRGGLLTAAFGLTGFTLVTIRVFPRIPLLLGAHLGWAVLLFGYIRILVTQSAPMDRVFLVMAAGILTGTLLMVGLDWILRRLDLSWKWTAAIGVLLLIGLGVLASKYGGRAFETAQSLMDLYAGGTSFGDRPQHLKDVFRVIRDHPLGLGVRGWWVTYPQYQPFGYIINIVHSHLGETAVSSGVIGAIGLVGLWMFTAINYTAGVRKGLGTLSWHALFWSAATLGFHGLVIDADMSFMSIAYMAFAVMGLFEGAAGDAPRPGKSRLTTVVSGFGAVLTVMLLSLLVGSMYSNRALAHAQEGRPDAARRAMEVALTLNPIEPIVHFNAASLAMTRAVGRNEAVFLAEAKKHYAAAVAVDPYRPDHRVRHAAFLADQGDLDEARAELEEAVSLAPWQIRFWESLLEFEIEAAKAFRDAGDQGQFRTHLVAAQGVLQRVYLQQAKLPDHPVAKTYGLNLESGKFKALSNQLKTLS